MCGTLEIRRDKRPDKVLVDVSACSVPGAVSAAYRAGYIAGRRDPHPRSPRIVLTPAGRLLVREVDADGSDRWTARVAKAFRTDPSAGLLALAGSRPEGPLPPSFAFWRDFAGLYLARLCRTPEGETSAAALEPAALPSDWGPASPTTWGWARRSRCWPCCSP